MRHPVRAVPPESHRPSSAQTAAGSALKACTALDIYLTICTAAHRRVGVVTLLGTAASTNKPGVRELPGSQTAQGGLWSHW